MACDIAQKYARNDIDIRKFCLLCIHILSITFKINLFSNYQSRQAFFYTHEIHKVSELISFQDVVTERCVYRCEYITDVVIVMRCLASPCR